MWLRENETVDANTPLVPFWNGPDTFWTSNEIKDTKVLGYAYPETQSWNYDTVQEYGAAVNASIAQLYSAEARAMLKGQAEMGETAVGLGRLLIEGAYTHWSVRCAVVGEGMPPSFIVKIFLEEAEAGAWTVMSSASYRTSAGAAKRSTIPETVSSGVKGDVGLTEALLEKIAAGSLASLDAMDVVAYLAETMTWKIISVRFLDPTFCNAGGIRNLT